MHVRMYVCVSISTYFIEMERYLRIKYLMCPRWSNKQGGVIATHLNIYFWRISLFFYLVYFTRAYQPILTCYVTPQRFLLLSQVANVIISLTTHKML